MKTWCTEIMAIDPIDGEMKKWIGPNVPGTTQKDAENYCQHNGLGYCKISNLLVVEIPCKKGTYEPDFENQIDYEIIESN